MLGVAGVLGQEILRPDVFWYEAGEPQNLPGPFQNVNMGGLLAWEFLLMHWVEVRRWQDYKNFGSVNEVRRREQVACYSFGVGTGMH
jgi:light-harvesting complex I chlorophyll a/b binding protein 4